MFIVIEGIDASGKTETTRAVMKKLEDRNYSVDFLSRKNPKIEDKEVLLYSEKLSGLVWNDNPNVFPKAFLSGDAWALQLALWFKVIEENCVKKSTCDIQIIDGWFYKYYARLLQNKQNNRQLMDTLMNLLDSCTYVFWLDVPPVKCWERRQQFKLTEIAPFGETVIDPKTSFVNFQTNISTVMKTLAKANQWKVIDCEGKSVDQISNEITEQIEVLLNGKEN